MLSKNIVKKEVKKALQQIITNENSDVSIYKKRTSFVCLYS